MKKLMFFNKIKILTPDGKLRGLLNKADNLLNKTKDNAKIERRKDALVDIIGKIRIRA